MADAVARSLLISLLLLALVDQTHLPNFLINFIWMWACEWWRKKQRVCLSQFTTNDQLIAQYTTQSMPMSLPTKNTFMKKPLSSFHSYASHFSINYGGIFSSHSLLCLSHLLLYGAAIDRPELKKNQCQILLRSNALRVSLQSRWMTSICLWPSF